MITHWIVGTTINDREDLEDIIKSLTPYHTFLTTKKSPIIELQDNTIPVFYGSFEQLNSVKKQFNVATYGMGVVSRKSFYSSYIPQDWFLNDDSILTTLGLFYQNESHYFKSGNIFIRPDTGFKIFTGQVIKQNNLQDFRKLNQIELETLVWISSEKHITNEYRFWICGKKVITWSEYSWEGEVINVVPDNVHKMAQMIADYDWQMDSCYVVDICDYYGVAKIIEFNSFSCSGLYECDAKKLFERVNEIVLEEWS